MDYYKVDTIEEKTVSKYLNINLKDVEELDLVEYLFYLKEAFIYNAMMTEEGREYLKNAYRLTQTNPDRESLRKKYNDK